MRLTKHHGLGNDFLVTADTGRPPDPVLARAACDRHRGVGADGLLFLGRGGDGAELTMVLLNADGSRAEMSGNGIGCLVQAALLDGLVAGPTVRVATDAGLRVVEVRPGDEERSHIVTAGMGAPAVGGEEPGWAGGDVRRAARVEVGNPHLVLQAADPGRLADRPWLAELGRKANAAIAGGVNLEVIAPGPGDDELAMDVWERGVGLTDACGTGAVASAAAARRWGLAGDRVTVRMVGGSVTVDLGGEEAHLTTTITAVATIDFPFP